MDGSGHETEVIAPHDARPMSCPGQARAGRPEAGHDAMDGHLLQYSEAAAYTALPHDLPTARSKL